MRKIGAVLLAAGLSERFGDANKLLADVGGKPVIRHAALALVDASIDDIVVVTGRDAETCRAALADLPIKFVHNERFRNGMGTSIAIGVAALGGDLDGALIVPGDMPFLTARLFTALIAAFADARGRLAIYPVTKSGEQQAPVLWPRHILPRLATLSGPEGGKVLLRDIAGETRAVSICEPSLLLDIDTVDDLEAARQRMAPSRAGG